VDVRLLAATNANPRDEVKAGRFREDLLFRLNTVEIYLPPLRGRHEDIPLLASHFLRQHAAKYGRRVQGFDESTMHALLASSWPGNVRELDHVVERAVLLAQGEAVLASDLSLRPARDSSARLEEMSLEEVERFLIQKALERFQGNVSEAARFLGLSRSGLYRRLQKYGL
jgi:DNA-binding NtrC family response regulator